VHKSWSNHDARSEKHQDIQLRLSPFVISVLTAYVML